MRNFGKIKYNILILGNVIQDGALIYTLRVYTNVNFT